MMRRYTYFRDLMGGCLVCHGDNAKWHGPNTQGVAARHHDATGHETWVQVVMSIRYGGRQSESEGPQNAHAHRASEASLVQRVVGRRR